MNREIAVRYVVAVQISGGGAMQCAGQYYADAIWGGLGGGGGAAGDARGSDAKARVRSCRSGLRVFADVSRGDRRQVERKFLRVPGEQVEAVLPVGAGGEVLA